MSDLAFCRKCDVETERNSRGSCKVCVRASAKAYRAAHPEKEKARWSAYQAANTSQIRLRRAAYRKANPERVKASNAKWYAANKDKARITTAAWRAANPEVFRIYIQNRNAKKKQGGELSKGIVKKLFTLQRGKCACCKQQLGDDFQLDHKMPLALGGSNTDDNMQLLRKRCNLQKSSKHPVDFMQSRGFLL